MSTVMDTVLVVTDDLRRLRRRSRLHRSQVQESPDQGFPSLPRPTTSSSAAAEGDELNMAITIATGWEKDQVDGWSLSNLRMR